MPIRRDRRAVRVQWLPAALGALAALVLARSALADNFVLAYYDPRADQLVVTMSYLGTNPEHSFSLHWGPCNSLPGGAGREIVAEVLDSQWQDAARKPFRKTTRFNLENLQCRPAKLTLRSAPRFYYTLQLPAPSSRAP